MATNLPWRQLIESYERDLRALFRAYKVLGAEGLADAEISRRFQLAAERVASRMVTGLSKANYKSWREAAFKSGNGRRIFGGLKQELAETHVRRTLERIARENARLITSVPQDIARVITLHSIKAQSEGKRAGEIEREIRELAPRLAESKVRLIARTEIGRAESTITQVRSEQMGLPVYVWETSDDERVRKSHRNMAGVLVPWNDPPAPERLVGERSTLSNYHAGACPNCRCLSLSLVSLNEIGWPHKLYGHGVIRVVTRREFQRLFPVAA